ncbi:hypothetical protein, partial [Geomonas sp.]|uniref:hypothetical protein n=1 Tax=Geomonas sp. TaxID=2651584 RepID=UPI002B48ED73
MLIGRPQVTVTASASGCPALLETKGATTKEAEAMRKRVLRKVLAVALAAAIVVLLPLVGSSHETGDEVFSQIGVTERLGGTVPKQLAFTDQ